ncbi:sensor histidine kinase, partial [Parabacteroides distasonis]
TKPLIQLCESVKYETSFTNETKLVLNQGENEIGILSDAFDAMLLRLEKTMQNVVDAKTGEVKAQLFALQAQMNPHFIHNTIAIIQSYALDEDYDTILKISESLSDLIRYSSEFTDEKVPLIDELKHVENYMDLVKLRYEEGINFKFEIEGKIENIFVPRFIVQPILENSLEHGLKSKHFPWEIRVSCFIKNDYWKVEIKDNGIGMSQDAIKRIYLYVDNMKKEDNKIINENLKIGGLSMKNIVTRLFLEYKCNMIFKIDSAQNSYTIITIGGKFK